MYVLTITRGSTFKKICLKVTAIYLKKHNLFQPVSHGINTRCAKNNFKIKKVTPGKHFEIVRTMLGTRMQ